MELPLGQQGGRYPRSSRKKKPMVVQYGYRDEDDDDSEDDEQRPGLFGKVLRNFNPNNHDDDSDDDSVNSKASVASKASETLKRLSDKLKFKKRNKQGSDDEDSLSSEEEEGEMDSSSVSKTFKRMTGKISNALRVTGGRHSSLGSDEEDEAEDEDELLSPHRRGSLFRRSAVGNNQASVPVRRVKSDSNEKIKMRLFRRNTTDECNKQGQGDSPRRPSTSRPRRAQSDGQHKMQSQEFFVSSASEDESGHFSDLSDDDSDNDDTGGRATYNPKTQNAKKKPTSNDKKKPPAPTTPHPDLKDQNDFSMNVTEEMLKWKEQNRGKI